MDGSADALGKSADSVVSSLTGMYDSIKDRLDKLQTELHKMERILDHVDQASFKLFPEENVVDAIDAQWIVDQKGGPKGVLFCTDHRLLFEQKEELATKRVLFIVTEKQKVQRLALEEPVGAVDQVKETESGAMLFRKDHLDVTFSADSTVRSAHFVLKGDSALWQQMINRLNAGEMETERVDREPMPAPAAPLSMPSQCPACGGRITQQLVRGMQSVKCRYCGTVIPLH